jgi:hypothetical protein
MADIYLPNRNAARLKKGSSLKLHPLKQLSDLVRHLFNVG